MGRGRQSRCYGSNPSSDFTSIRYLRVPVLAKHQVPWPNQRRLDSTPLKPHPALCHATRLRSQRPATVTEGPSATQATTTLRTAPSTHTAQASHVAVAPTVTATTAAAAENPAAATVTTAKRSAGSSLARQAAAHWMRANATQRSTCAGIGEVSARVGDAPIVYAATTDPEAADSTKDVAVRRPTSQRRGRAVRRRVTTRPQVARAMSKGGGGHRVVGRSSSRRQEPAYRTP